MGLFSILPESFSTIETWLTRIFVSLATITPHASPNSLTSLQLVLGTIIIGPWLLLLVYDILLYFWRSATYELPYIGGRARGKRRPRAPSLAERPDGRHRRKISIPGVSRQSEDDVSAIGAKWNSTDFGNRRAFEAVIEDE